MNLSSTFLSWRRVRAALLEGHSGRYRADEVRALLSPGTGHTEHCGRRRAALSTAAQPSAWSSRRGGRDDGELGRLSARLPAIVALYATGRSFRQISAEVGGWGEWEIQQALDTARARIASRLNDRHLLPVRGAEGPTICTCGAAG